MSSYLHLEVTQKGRNEINADHAYYRLVNELHDRTVVIRPIDPRFDPTKPVLVPGKTVLLQLGFDPGQDLCALGMPCSSWANLEVLAAWVAGGLLASYVLLRWGVTDPH